MCIFIKWNQQKAYGLLYWDTRFIAEAWNKNFNISEDAYSASLLTCVIIYAHQLPNTEQAILSIPGTWLWPIIFFVIFLDFIFKF